MRLASVLILVLAPIVTHGQTVTMPAGGIIPTPDLANGDTLLLEANTGVSNDLIVLQDLSYTNPLTSALESMIWQGPTPGSQIPVGLWATDLSSDPKDFTLGIRTLTLRDVAMQMTSLDPANSGSSVRFDFSAVPSGTPVGITFENASLTLPVKPLWLSTSTMTLHSLSGTNTVSELSGNQSPTVLDVDSGSTLQFFGCGLLGGGSQPDSSRLNFNSAGNSGDVDGGILDINRSHVIFSGDLGVRNGGQLQVNGPESVLDLKGGNLDLESGSLAMSGGGTSLVTTGILRLNEATITQASGSQVNVGTVDVDGSNTVSFSGSGYDNGTLMQADAIVIGRDAGLEFDGSFGTVQTPAVITSGTSGTASLQVNGSTRLEITPSGGIQSSLTAGTMTVGTDAQLRVDSGGILSSRIPVTNNGSITVAGEWFADGTVDGAGFVRIETGGRLGINNEVGNETLTFNQTLRLDALSTLQLAINPTNNRHQQLITTGELSLGSIFVGAALDVRVFDDQVLPFGTVFPIVDYDPSHPPEGFFETPDGDRLNEGDWLSLGLNQYRFSYADAAYSPTDPSVSTLTVIPKIPEPSTFMLAALGLLGLLGWRRRRRR